MARPRLGDLVSPSYPVFRHDKKDFPTWGTVVAEHGFYLDVMWSNGKVEEFWTEQDLTVHEENSYPHEREHIPSPPRPSPS